MLPAQARPGPPDPAAPRPSDPACGHVAPCSGPPRCWANSRRARCLFGCGRQPPPPDSRNSDRKRWFRRTLRQTLEAPRSRLQHVDQPTDLTSANSARRSQAPNAASSSRLLGAEQQRGHRQGVARRQRWNRGRVLGTGQDLSGDRSSPQSIGQAEPRRVCGPAASSGPHEGLMKASSMSHQCLNRPPAPDHPRMRTSPGPHRQLRCLQALAWWPGRKWCLVHRRGHHDALPQVAHQPPRKHAGAATWGRRCRWRRTGGPCPRGRRPRGWSSYPGAHAGVGQDGVGRADGGPGQGVGGHGSEVLGRRPGSIQLELQDCRRALPARAGRIWPRSFHEHDALVGFTSLLTKLRKRRRTSGVGHRGLPFALVGGPPRAASAPPARRPGPACRRG
jgi:hypothetical protein